MVETNGNGTDDGRSLVKCRMYWHKTKDIAVIELRFKKKAWAILGKIVADSVEPIGVGNGHTRKAIRKIAMSRLNADHIQFFRDDIYQKDEVIIERDNYYEGEKVMRVLQELLVTANKCGQEIDKVVNVDIIEKRSETNGVGSQ